MVVQDFGPAEIWSKAVVVRALGAEMARHEAMRMAGYVLRDRAASEGGIVTASGAFNEIQCPLDGLRKAGFLGDGEQAKRRFEAGEMLFELFVNSGIQGRVTANLSGGCGGGIREQDDFQAEDEMRYYRALKAIGPYGAPVSAVCVQHISPPGRRKAIDTLNTGLDLLSSHFEKPKTTSSKHEKRVG